jgi:hypothetical protein
MTTVARGHTTYIDSGGGTFAEIAVRVTSHAAAVVLGCMVLAECFSASRTSFDVTLTTSGKHTCFRTRHNQKEKYANKMFLQGFLVVYGKL